MIQSGWYMASTSTIHPRYDGTMGVIQTQIPSLKLATRGISRRRLSNSIPWCLDNGVFTDKFEVGYWLKRLDVFKEYAPTCLFVVVPDVVGDCIATLAQFDYYRKMIKDFPVALVSQDGISQQAHKIPWNNFDCLFVGGSDEHKLGKEGGWIINEAKRRGKWVHIGRVNSASRILKFWQADSWDGTHLGFNPSDVSKFNAAVLQVRSMKKSKGLFDDLHNNVFSGDYFS